MEVLILVFFRRFLKSSKKKDSLSKIKLSEIGAGIGLPASTQMNELDSASGKRVKELDKLDIKGLVDAFEKEKNLAIKYRRSIAR